MATLAGLCVCVGAILLLLLHHKAAHAAPGEGHIADPCEQWFQWRVYPAGDVCNWTTCSHEMWVIGLFVLGVLAVPALVAGECV